MKKITSLLLLMSMLVMCFAVTSVSAATNDNLQYLLVDALAWSGESVSATETFNNEVLKLCSESADFDALTTKTLEMIGDYSTSDKVKAFDAAAVNAALQSFAQAETSSLTSVGKTVQQIYTEREFESKTTYTGQIGVGGYYGDGIETIIPDTGAVTGYNFENLRKTVNTAITGEEDNNNGLRFTLLYLREQVYINHKIGITANNTHISSFDTYTDDFDFYVSKKVTSEAAKNQIIGTTSDLITMLPALKAEVEAKEGDNLTEKFMVYIEDLLNACDTDEKNDFYKFLDENNREDEGIIITSKSSAPSYGGGGGATTVLVTFANTIGGVIDGETTERVRYGTKLSSVPEPVPAEGYVFKGWSIDGGETIIDPATVTINKKITFTAIFAPEGSVAPGVDDGPFDLSSHYAYMQGYPDGSFKPEGNMTRAEVAVMFSRLLANKMNINENYPCNFTDVNEDDWFKNSVGYMSQLGVINGYPDGTFNPNGSITRAEFATIASRFDKLTTGNASEFVDIDDSHWAFEYIGFAANHGWITGYEDNTVRPDSRITRAEVVTVTNRMLGRVATAEHTSYIAMPKDFTDVDSTDWFYFDVVEATNDHDIPEAEAETDETTEAVEDEETATDAADETVETETAEGTEEVEEPAEGEEVAAGEETTEESAETTDTEETPAE